MPAVARTVAALSTALMLISSGQVLADQPRPTNPYDSPPPPTWTMNLYDSSVVRYQDPDWQACTAAATESMLNLIALTSVDDMPPPRGGSLPRSNFRWQIDTSYDFQESILEYERENMTMYASAPGTDPHGWRNALNYWGWSTAAAGVYVDSAYDSFDAAAQATVHALARTNKPVGILGWFGGHAQYVTGYKVQGGDPRVSDDYTILGIFLTDPLGSDQIGNVLLSYADWANGPLYLRFSPYWQNESPFVDGLDGQVGDREWRGRWVIIQPVK